MNLIRITMRLKQNLKGSYSSPEYILIFNYKSSLFMRVMEREFSFFTNSFPLFGVRFIIAAICNYVFGVDRID